MIDLNTILAIAGLALAALAGFFGFRSGKKSARGEQAAKDLGQAQESIRRTEEVRHEEARREQEVRRTDDADLDERVRRWERPGR